MSLLLIPVNATTTTTTTMTTAPAWPAVDPAAASGKQSAPWNADSYLVTPTPDGTGIGVHPSVVDFYNSPWRGWRYWMAFTPYASSNDDVENPCILVSNDGLAWQIPSGLTNPIEPWPGDTAYNSDPELVYDPDGDRLICFWRKVDAGEVAAHTYAKWSTDGVTWSARQSVIANQGVGDCLSPSVVRRATNDWWLFGIKRASGMGVNVYRSTDPLTGWSAPTAASLGVADPWHAGVVWDGNAFRMLLVDAGGTFDMRALSSPDGVAWSTSGVVMTSRSGSWDSKLYRPSIQVRDGSWMRVWYSATTSSQWHIAETQMPRSLWPA